MQLKAAVIGHPIAHSKSPALHQAAYQVLGVAIDYLLIDVSPNELPGFVQRVRADGDWAGVSVTMPHKSAMLHLVDDVEAAAASTGALNTVLVDRGGQRLTGRNTDIIGIIRALGHAGMASVGSAALLGGGGTARAALAALPQLDCRNVVGYLREPAKGAELAEFANSLGLSMTVLPLAAAVELEAELVISTLPPGAADGLASAIRQNRREAGNVLLDVAYDPWPSRLGQAWADSGGAVVSGLEMLLYQAVEQVAAFSATDLEGRTDVINVMCDSIGLPER